MAQAPNITTAPLTPIPAAETHGADEAHDVAIDRGFGRAIIIGAVLGIVAFTLLIAGATKLMAPDWDTPAIAAVAVWTGIWGGLFLGGTITVGRWSSRNFH